MLYSRNFFNIHVNIKQFISVEISIGKMRRLRSESVMIKNPYNLLGLRAFKGFGLMQNSRLNLTWMQIKWTLESFTILS